jgi:peptidoglycan-N-acetylglucosamine deacetylase
VTPVDPVLHRYEINEPLVALTFDDGPSDWTDSILDLLVEHEQAATFFVLGRHVKGKQRIETLARIAQVGSEAENHTFSHRDVRDLHAEEVRAELARTNSLIEEVTGRLPLFWRPPSFKVGERVRADVLPLGLREIGCSIDPRDYAYESTPEVIVERVVESPEFRPGAIIDLHDGRARTDGNATAATRRATVAAVGTILDVMAERGWRSVTISRLLAAH